MTGSEWLEAQPDLISCKIGLNGRITLRACHKRQKTYPKMIRRKFEQDIDDYIASRWFYACQNCPHFLPPENRDEELTKGNKLHLGTVERGRNGWNKVDGRDKNAARCADILKRLNEPGDATIKRWRERRRKTGRDEPYKYKRGSDV